MTDGKPKQSKAKPAKGKYASQNARRNKDARGYRH